ncbi:hypothetical protein BIZ35_12840 [Heyndrickxia coagulans]|jgi:hypothetical protein|nr:hypothetical protein BIZ35_12840 [Heyndrickxia coagulans]
MTFTKKNGFFRFKKSQFFSAALPACCSGERLLRKKADSSALKKATGAAVAFLMGRRQLLPYRHFYL